MVNALEEMVDTPVLIIGMDAGGDLRGSALSLTEGGV